MGGALSAWAQGISFDNRREVVIPDYTTLRIGPFYSTAILRASAGYRYTTSSGAGSDYIYGGRRGRILEDGSEIPVTVMMDFLNYWAISRHTSLDVSVRVAYRYYPLDTQEDDFSVTIPDEVATANLAWDYYFTRYLRGTVYDYMRYEADYVDTRGFQDDVGGRRFESFRNRVGTTLLWLLSTDSNLGLTLERMDLWVLDNEEEFGDQERTEYREALFYERQLLERIVVGGRVDYVQRDYKVETRSDTTQTDYSLFARGNEQVGGGIPLTDHTTLSLRVGASTGATRGSRGSRNETDEEGATVDVDRRDADDDVTVLTTSAELATQMTRYLSHAILYEHGLRGGFNSDFEEYDRWRYNVSYNRPGVNVRVFSEYNTVEPTGNDESAYDEWNSGIEIRYPLLSFLDLTGSYVYTRRTNETQSPDEDDPAETRDDYYTRRVRLGTSVNIVTSLDTRQAIRWITYVERYERLSDLNELEFTRDTFETTLQYTHRF